MHVGQDKTGSSFIQSALANSIYSLKECGIYYPTNPNILKAKSGKISSGNGVLLENLGSTKFDKLSSIAAKKFLFSSEMLFRKLTEPAYFDNINSELRDRLGFESINLLLFIREPSDHLGSAYGQSIKRGGYFGSIAEFSEKYSKHINAVRRFVQFCYDNQQQVRLSTVNYSKQGPKALEIIENWLDIPSRTLQSPKSSIVNRSMTFAELEFQKLANKKYGASARLLSDKLCHYLPLIKPDKICIPTDVQELLVKKVIPVCKKIDEMLLEMNSSNETYSYELYGSYEVPIKYELTNEQIGVIYSSLEELYKENANL